MSVKICLHPSLVSLTLRSCSSSAESMSDTFRKTNPPSILTVKQRKAPVAASVHVSLRSSSSTSNGEDLHAKCVIEKDSKPHQGTYTIEIAVLAHLDLVSNHDSAFGIGFRIFQFDD